MPTQTTSPQPPAAARRRQLLVQRELARLRALHARSAREQRLAGRHGDEPAATVAPQRGSRS